MKTKHFISIAGIILIIGISLYCIGAIRHSHANKLAAPFSVRTERDSIYVYGAKYFSKTLTIPREYDSPALDFLYENH